MSENPTLVLQSKELWINLYPHFRLPVYSEGGFGVEGPKVAKPDAGPVRRDEEPRVQSYRWEDLRAVAHCETHYIVGQKSVS